MQAFIDDDFLPLESTVIPIWDLGFTQGIAVTEQLRTVGGKLWMLDRHLDRLDQSLRLSGLSWPRPRDDIKNLTEQLVERNSRELLQGDDLGVCIVVTGGDQLNFVPDKSRNAVRLSRLIIHPVRLRHAYWHERYTNGASLISSSIREIPNACVPKSIKTRNRLHYWIARQQTETVDKDSIPLLLDIQGQVAECPTMTIVAVFSNKQSCLTPPPDSILPGITLEWFQRNCATLRLKMERREFSVAELQTADEILALSTPPFAISVVAVDGKSVGEGVPGRYFDQVIKLVRDQTGVDVVEQSRKFSARQC